MDAANKRANEARVVPAASAKLTERVMEERVMKAAATLNERVLEAAAKIVAEEPVPPEMVDMAVAALRKHTMDVLSAQELSAHRMKKVKAASQHN